MVWILEVQTTGILVGWAFGAYHINSHPHPRAERMIQLSVALRVEICMRGVALGDSVHLIYTFLEIFLLVRERTVQFLTIPGNLLQQFLQPLVVTSALFEG